MSSFAFRRRATSSKASHSTNGRIIEAAASGDMAIGIGCEGRGVACGLRRWSNVSGLEVSAAFNIVPLVGGEGQSSRGRGVVDGAELLLLLGDEVVVGEVGMCPFLGLRLCFLYLTYCKRMT